MPRDLSSIRLARLNELLRILGSAPCIPRKQLLEELGGCTGRTLERDLDYRVAPEFGKNRTLSFSEFCGDPRFVNWHRLGMIPQFWYNMLVGSSRKRLGE